MCHPVYYAERVTAKQSVLLHDEFHSHEQAINYQAVLKCECITLDFRMDLHFGFYLINMQNVNGYNILHI